MLGDLLPTSLSGRLAMLGSEMMMRLGESYSCLDPNKNHFGSLYANNTLTMKTLAATTASHLKQPTKVLEKTITPAASADLLDASGASVTGKLFDAVSQVEQDYSHLFKFVIENRGDETEGVLKAARDLSGVVSNLNKIDLSKIINDLQQSATDAVQAAQENLDKVIAAFRGLIFSNSEGVELAASAKATAEQILQERVNEQKRVNDLVEYLQLHLQALLDEAKEILSESSLCDSLKEAESCIEYFGEHEFRWAFLPDDIKNAIKFAKSQRFVSEEVAEITVEEFATYAVKMEIARLERIPTWIEKFLKKAEVAESQIRSLSGEKLRKIKEIFSADVLDQIVQKLFSEDVIFERIVTKNPSIARVGRTFRQLSESLQQMEELDKFVASYLKLSQKFIADLKENLTPTYSSFYKNFMKWLEGKKNASPAVEAVAANPELIQLGPVSKTISWALTALGIGANLAQQLHVNQQRELAHPKPKTNRKGWLEI